MELEYAVLAVVALLIIVAVAHFSAKLGVAAPLLLVVVGVGCSYIPGAPTIEVPPEIILMVVLPPILYSAAVNVPLVDFRRDFRAISGLSVILVVVSAFGTGLLFYLLFPELTLPAAIALGAVISPPDAVAATSIGKRLGLPPRLVTVLEGEGLVNDATALVMLRSAIAATAGAVTVWGVIGDFAYAVAMAIGVGLLVGLVSAWVRSKLGDPVLTTAISFAVPFLAFIPAEELGASGVLAVVVAGLVTGHQSARLFSAQERVSERINWRTIQLILENGVFLLMGFEMHMIINEVHEQNLGVGPAVGIGLLAAAALIFIRGLFVIPLVATLRWEQGRSRRRAPRLESMEERVAAVTEKADPDDRRVRRITRFVARARADADFLQKEGLGWRGGAVLAWSGMRGVVTLAAAQSLPQETPYRSQLVLIAFTVALVTLLLQGGTLPLVIKKLRIVGSDEEADRVELAALMEEVGTLGAAVLDNPELRQSSGDPYDEEVLARVRKENLAVVNALGSARDTDESSPKKQQIALRRMVLEAERNALLDARATGSYSSRVLQTAQSLLDFRESRVEQLSGGSH